MCSLADFDAEKKEDFIFSDEYFKSLETQYNLNKWCISEFKNKLHQSGSYEYDLTLDQIQTLINPKNYPFSNKSIIEKTINSNGKNLYNGFKAFQHNIKNNTVPMLSQIDCFKLGENIATTKGYVIFENNLMQLIHYVPQKRSIYQQPLLIIPPWINKFYIFDMGEKKSFVQFMLSKGIDVYIISWKNPQKEDKNLSLKCYIKEGIGKALTIINQETHLLGFCLGGVAALIASIINSEKRIKSLSLLATPIDFSKLTELQSFIQPVDLKKYKKNIRRKGYHCGKDLLRMFCMMRAEVMILNNAIDQYYLDKKPKPNDFLYWNMDSTNLPAKMHIEYMEKFLMKNQLFEGKYIFDKNKLSIGDLKIPLFILATAKDHIVPYQSAFSIQKFNLECTYVLAGSGHIAGVINAPEAKKYAYQVYDQFGNFIKSRKYSWWTEWSKWLTPRMGALTSNVADHPTIEAAPGSFACAQPALIPYLNTWTV